MRKLMLPVGIGVAAAAVAAAAVWVFAGDRGSGADVVATPAPTVTTSPSVVVAIEASMPSSEYFPVNSLGADDVNWADVGPGWFVVAWQYEADRIVDDPGYDPVGRASDGITLLDPEGRFYTIRTLEDLDVSGVTGFIGTKLELWREDLLAFSFYPVGDTVTLDLMTGEARTVLEDTIAYVPYSEDGSPVVSGNFGGDTTGYALYQNGEAIADLCGGPGVPSGTLSPSGRWLVCLDYGGEGKTNVVLSDTQAPFVTEQIDVFMHASEDYALAGWIDESTFLVSRMDEEGDRVYYAYNVLDRTIRDFDPQLPVSTDLAVFDYTSRTYLIRGEQAVWIYSETGARRLAFHPCNAPYSDWLTVTYSGTRAVVTCTEGVPTVDSGWTPEHTKLWLVDLEDWGDTVAVVDVELGSFDGVRTVIGYRSRPCGSEINCSTG